MQCFKLTLWFFFLFFLNANIAESTVMNTNELNNRAKKNICALIQGIDALEPPSFCAYNNKKSTNYLYIHIIALSVDPNNRNGHQNCNKTSNIRTRESPIIPTFDKYKFVATVHVMRAFARNLIWCGHWSLTRAPVPIHSFTLRLQLDTMHNNHTIFQHFWNVSAGFSSCNVYVWSQVFRYYLNVERTIKIYYPFD